MKKLLFILLICGIQNAKAYSGLNRDSVHLQKGNIRYLVFDGGGVRGIAYAGVLKALEEEGIRNQISKIAATSVGSVIAMMITLGYSSHEVQDEIQKLEMHKFNDGSLFGAFKRLKKSFGFYKGERLLRWIESVIEKKGLSKNITFEELYQRSGIELYLTATALNLQKQILLSRHTFPDMQVKIAVRSSMSIPLYFQAIRIDSNGGYITRESNFNHTDYLLIDGGFLNNYPIHTFDSVYYTTDGKPQFIPNAQTIGFNIEDENQVIFDRNKNYELATYPIHTLKDYIGGFYNIVLENLNRGNLNYNDWNRTVFVSSKNIGPKVKKMSKENSMLLIQSGYDSTKDFLKSLQ